MKTKPITLPPRLLALHDPDVPPEFVVIEASDSFEACDMAYDVFADPSISLVVWRKASLIPHLTGDEAKQDALKAAVSDLTARVQRTCKIKTNLDVSRTSFFEPDIDFMEGAIKQHFSDIADKTHATMSDVKLWEESVLSLTESLEDSFNARDVKLTTRFQIAAQDYDGTHRDIGLRSNSLRILRVVDGDTPRFYSRGDVARENYYKGSLSVVLKDKAQPWTMAPWDIAFVSQNAVHESPLNGNGRRALEVYDLRGRTEFVAGAERPFFRRLFRRPAFDPYEI